MYFVASLLSWCTMMLNGSVGAGPNVPGCVSERPSSAISTAMSVPFFAASMRANVASSGLVPAASIVCSSRKLA